MTFLEFQPFIVIYFADSVVDILILTNKVQLIRRFYHYWSGKFEQFVLFTVDVIYDRRRDRRTTIYAYFLRLLSQLFSMVVQLRLFLYKNRVLKNQPLGCLVVVVGNLTVGGTGKTPVVEKLARTFAERGRKVAILSRGYKSKPEPFYKVCWRLLTHIEAPPPKVVSNEKKVLLDSESAGDEPYMLAINLPGIPVIIDKDRVKAGSYAIKRFGVDTLILDDGFQYMALKGQLNLLLIDKANPFGNRQLLPRGILREPIKHLHRASYIFLTKSEGQPDDALKSLIKQYNPGAEIIECAHQPRFLQEVNSDCRRELSFLEGKRIGAFSAIATPESFESLLREFKAQLVYNRRFLDHHRFSLEELSDFFRQAKEADLEMVVTTEKDAVRIPEDFDPGIPFYYLRVEIEILSGTEDFERAVSRICSPKRAFNRDQLITPK